MRREKSAGVIVFRMERNRPVFLILQNSSKFFWDFPKGNIEPGESEDKAALRELEEEAGLKKVKLLPGFIERCEYFYTFEGEKIHKELVMFLGEERNTEEVSISWEHSSFDWAPYEAAKAKLKGMKCDLITKASDFLSSKLDNWTKGRGQVK